MSDLGSGLKKTEISRSKKASLFYFETLLKIPLTVKLKPPPKI